MGGRPSGRHARRWTLAWPARTARVALQRLVVFPIVSVLTPITVLNRERLRRLSPPVVVVANHVSHFDTPVILKALPGKIRRRLVVAAAEDYFYRGRVRGFLVSLSFATIPFNRAEGSRDSLDECVSLLRRGWSVLVFPEGTRSMSGEIGRVRRGAAVLACDSRSPILPLYVHGLAAVLPKGTTAPLPGGVVVMVGSVIAPGSDVDETRDAIESEMLLLAEERPHWGPATAGTG